MRGRYAGTVTARWHERICPGRPVKNGFIESFNGELRDECQNQHHFATLAEGRDRVETWRQGLSISRLQV